MKREPIYPIGTVYKTRHKHPHTCTVIDVHTTYNLAGEVVKLRYVSTHEFIGQTVIDRDVVEATIAMGLIESKGRAE